MPSSPVVSLSKNDVSLWIFILVSHTLLGYVMACTGRMSLSNLFGNLLQDLLSIRIRRGGFDVGQSHQKWLSTVSQYPSAISMSFVPISSLLSGVRGSGFLSHAINLYLRCEYDLYYVYKY